ncbi:MAG: L,D-transpeptidase [Alphaproteobacteria bacterium]|nr:L,D-transpeptidase [Alphaproteobacteria bacterium]
MRVSVYLAAVAVTLLGIGQAAAEAIDWPIVYDVPAKVAPAQELAAAEPAPPPPPPVTLKLAINLTKQRLTVTENGNVKYTFKISSGRSGYATPTGTYRPQWMARMWHSRKYDWAPMPHSIFFHRGYAIHATYATRRLGRPASHGCIRLSPRNAKTVYRLVSKHGKASTKISITGRAIQSAPRIARKRYKKRRYARRYRQLPPGYAYSYRRPPPGAYGYRPRRVRRTYRAY